MDDRMYSAEEVADLLGLHVRTVRGYIRSGRLRATRIGKQYRIARADLEELTGPPEPAGQSARAEVSSIVQIDDVDRRTADRLSTLVMGMAQADAGPLRIQVVQEGERRRMKIVILGGAADTAELLRLIDALLGSEAGDD
jgi:excisionase family DNA binding protein